MTDEIRIVTPVGMLGYGYPAVDFWRAINAGADAIVIDSGSTDNGPQELGLGLRTCADSAYRRDLEPMVEACATRHIPLLIGSAGGTGSNEQVDFMVELIRAIAADQGHKLRIAAIYADIPKVIVHARLAAGRIEPCGPVPPLDAAAIDTSVAIVAQMGVEPFLAALSEAST